MLDEITVAGKRALFCLYGAQGKTNLNALRYKRFYEKVVKSLINLLIRSSG